jgi:heterodisulfide reductase subunit C
MDKLTEDAVEEIEQIHSSGSSSKSLEKIKACWRCALMTSSCGRLTRSLCSDAWRFRRSWRTGLREFTALRFPIAGFEVQTRLLT